MAADALSPLENETEIREENMEAINIAESSPRLTTGVLTEVSGSDYQIQFDGYCVAAGRAESCLLIPRIGDRVLVAVLPEETVIIAVLPRATHEETSIGVAGNLSVRVPRGAVSVLARDEIELTSMKRLSLLTQELKVRAEEGSAFLGKFALAGQRLHAEVSRINVVSEIVDRVAGRVSDRVKRSFRRVEEIDSVSAELIDYRARNTMALRSKQAFIAGDDLVKVDGEQIHFG